MTKAKDNAMVETAEKRQSYGIYLSLGVNRSCEAVAMHTGKPLRTIQDWCKKFNWEARAIYDQQVNGMFSPGQEDPVINHPDLVLEYDEETGIKYPIDAYVSPGDLEHGRYISSKGGTMTRPEYRLLLGGMIRDFAKRFQEGEVEIRTVNEFEKVVKLDMLLMGEPTKRVDHTGEIDHNGLPTTVNQYQLNVEQIIHGNPKMQELIGEMWREYNGKRDENGNLNTNTHINKNVTDYPDQPSTLALGGPNSSSVLGKSSTITVIDDPAIPPEGVPVVADMGAPSTPKFIDDESIDEKLLQKTEIKDALWNMGSSLIGAFSAPSGKVR